MAVTRIDFIRHGEPQGGAMYRGSAVDHPLSEKGWAQMRRALGDACLWNAVVSSPLQRCLAFAQEVGQRCGLPVSVEPDFREVGFGSWEGRTRAQIQATDPKGYAAFYRDPVNARPARAEDLIAFGRRVSAALERLIENHPGDHLLVVAHAGVIRAALGHVLQAPPACWYRTRVDNAALTRFEAHPETGLQLVFHNRPKLDCQEKS